MNSGRYLLHGDIFNCTRPAIYVQRNKGALSCNYCCSGKELSITYSECVSVTLIIQQAKRMRLFVFSYEACPVVPYSSTLLLLLLLLLLLFICLFIS
jgi:hypothetical protein